MTIRQFVQCVLAFTILISTPMTTFAQTVWLSDVLFVNVRTGPSSEFRTLKAIRSDTRMEVLEESEDSDYLRVRTEDGLEGWVPKRYTLDEPTGRIRAANLEAEKNQLQAQFDALDSKYKALLADKGDVNGELESLRTSNASLTTELNRIKAISENAISLDAQYQELAEENAQVKNDLDVLSAENRSLKEYNDNQMLLFGGLLIVAGVVLGVLLPRLTGRRRKDGWS